MMDIVKYEDCAKNKLSASPDKICFGDICKDYMAQDAMPFFYYDREVVYDYNYHSDNHYTLINDLTPEIIIKTNHNTRPFIYKYGGRFWADSKIITFWQINAFTLMSIKEMLAYPDIEGMIDYMVACEYDNDVYLVPVKTMLRYCVDKITDIPELYRKQEEQKKKSAAQSQSFKKHLDDKNIWRHYEVVGEKINRIIKQVINEYDRNFSKRVCRP